jgi:hypothetical protein
LGLEEALRKLRYVPRYPLPGSEVRSEDHNSIVDALKALSAEARARMPGDPLVDALDAAIAKIRYLRTGDIYEPEDHNYIVDALKVSRDVLDKMESYYAAQVAELKAEIDRLRAELEALRAQLPPPPYALVEVGLAVFVAAPPPYEVAYPPPPPNTALAAAVDGVELAETILAGVIAYYAG